MLFIKTVQLNEFLLLGIGFLVIFQENIKDHRNDSGLSNSKSVPKLIARPFAIYFLQIMMYLNIAKEFSS